MGTRKQKPTPLEITKRQLFERPICITEFSVKNENSNQLLQRPTLYIQYLVVFIAGAHYKDDTFLFKSRKWR